ncbi:MAG TPA: ester cyclase [Burkholderiales bacterium]|jgi:predicted SnoaL-like aldol condensation-catalyzing enzyme
MAQSAYVPRAQEARNKSVVERYFREVLDEGRIERMPDLLARDVVLHRPGFDVIGLDAAMKRLRAVLEDFSAFSTELSGLMAEGDMVAARVSHRTRVRAHAFRSRAGEVNLAREQPLDWTALVQFRFQDGKIAEEWVMRDELGMLLQMGRVTVQP